MMKNIQQTFGHSALERMAEAPRFNLWMYTTISPFLKGRILEVGSGIGNLSSYFIKDGRDITLTEYDEAYLDLLLQKFPGLPPQKIFQLNIADPLLPDRGNALQESYDSVFLLNVLEHIEDDFTAIRNCAFLLKPGGRLLILVPAYHFLYSKTDQLLGHYRRYSSRSLNTVATAGGLIIEKNFSFNLLGIAGWWWNKVVHQGNISQKQMKVYNSLVPFATVLDKAVGHKLGLSVIAVAKKPLR